MKRRKAVETLCRLEEREESDLLLPLPPPIETLSQQLEGGAFPNKELIVGRETEGSLANQEERRESLSLPISIGSRWLILLNVSITSQAITGREIHQAFAEGRGDESKASAAAAAATFDLTGGFGRMKEENISITPPPHQPSFKLHMFEGGKPYTYLEFKDEDMAREFFLKWNGKRVVFPYLDDEEEEVFRQFDLDLDLNKDLDLGDSFSSLSGEMENGKEPQQRRERERKAIALIIAFANEKGLPTFPPSPLLGQKEVQQSSLLNDQGFQYCENSLSPLEEVELLKEIIDSSKGRWKTLNKRRVCHFGGRFSYLLNGIDYLHAEGKVPPLPDWTSPLLTKACKSLGLTYTPTLFNQLTINWYNGGEGGISPHIDTHSSFHSPPGILIISLAGGITMDFECLFTPPSSNEEGKQASIYLEGRSLLHLCGRSSLVWSHGIKERKRDYLKGEVTSSRRQRISLTFRKIRDIGDPPCACGHGKQICY